MKLAHRERKSAATAEPAATNQSDTKGTAAKSVVPFAVKAADDGARTITGLAAAWTLDSGGDMIEPGAFKRTLQNWRASQKAKPIPLLDQHDYRASRSVLGKMIDAEETADGLLATFEFIPDDPDADAVYRRVKGGYITGLSIGYRAIRWEYEQKEGGAEWERVRRLKEVALLEVSVVTWPMNDDARIEAVKAAPFAALADALKHGRLSPAQKTELRALLNAAGTAGATKGTGSQYAVGDRVAVVGEPHMEGQAVGEVREAVTTWTYGIVFDGMEDMGVHRWYVEGELLPESDDDADDADDMDEMDGMSADDDDVEAMGRHRRRRRRRRRRPHAGMAGMSGATPDSQHLRALLADSPADTQPDADTGDAAPSDAEPKGLAPEEQDALKQRILALKLRSLVARAA